jgi:HD-like signal output (HDOD) protein
MWERRLLGFDNAEVGAAILAKWNFPEDIVAPVKWQLTPLKAESHREMACILAIARSVSHHIKGTAPLPDFPKLRIDRDILAAAGLDADGIVDALADARAGLEEMNSLFK